MPFPYTFGVAQIIRAFPFRIATTWALVLLEIVLLTLIPLMIGYAIDGLLAGRPDELALLGAIMVGLTAILVVRRLYDTRAYGSIRVFLGAALDRRYPDIPVSSRTARLDMARELVDFLENEMPTLLTAVIQIFITLVVLAAFDIRLAYSAAGVTLVMLIMYGFFHGRFFRLNAALNEQKEKQVGVLGEGRSTSVFSHLRKLRGFEVRLSDTEALLYGLIFLLQIGFIVFNLWLAASLPEITAGRIFSIVTYSWEYVGAAIALPTGLQTWSRLNEITGRLNKPRNGDGNATKN